MRKKNSVTKTITEIPVTHPMENVLDIECGTTLVPHQEQHTHIITTETYDVKDEEVENQFQEVYDKAITAFDDQTSSIELIDPRYRSRNQEVAVQYLNTALDAAREKSSLKQHKDKITIAKGKIQGPKTLNQNLIFADRNELLKIIHGESQQVTTNETI